MIWSGSRLAYMQNASSIGRRYGIVGRGIAAPVLPQAVEPRPHARVVGKGRRMMGGSGGVVAVTIVLGVDASSEEWRRSRAAVVDRVWTDLKVRPDGLSRMDAPHASGRRLSWRADRSEDLSLRVRPNRTTNWTLRTNDSHLHRQAVLLGELLDLCDARGVVGLRGRLDHLRGLQLLDDLVVALERLCRTCLRSTCSSNGGRGRWPPPSHDSAG